MFWRKKEAAFANWPKTEELGDRAGVHVTGKYLHPATPKKTDTVFLFICFGIPLYVWSASGQFMGAFGLLVILILTSAAVLRPLSHLLLRKNVDVKVLPERIEVKGLFGYKHYPRTVPIEFRVDRHHKAMQEEAQEMKAGERQSRTYREAVEVVMQYGERRVVLAAMREKDMEKAKALVIRLQSWCEGFDQAVKRVDAGQISPVGEEQVVSGGDFGPAPDIR